MGLKPTVLSRNVCVASATVEYNVGRYSIVADATTIVTALFTVML